MSEIKTDKVLIQIIGDLTNGFKFYGPYREADFCFGSYWPPDTSVAELNPPNSEPEE